MFASDEPLISISDLERNEQNKTLTALNVAELEDYSSPPVQNILSPWLHEASLTLLHAERGLGKTWFASSAALCIASGGEFLSFRAEKPRKVIVFDGEMQTHLMKERLKILMPLFPRFEPQNLRFVLSGLQRDGLPDLGRSDAYRHYDEIIQDADVVIVDNLSSIVRSLQGNNNDEWHVYNSWCVRMRNEGKSVLTVHHSGKNGNSRGASRLEDPLDTVIKLSKPGNYQEQDGCHFNIEFPKHRQFFGDEAKPIRGWLKNGRWEQLEFEPGYSDNDLFSLKASGASYREMSEKTGIPKTTIERRLKNSTVPRDIS